MAVKAQVAGNFQVIGERSRSGEHGHIVVFHVFLMGIPLRWRVVTYSACVIRCKAIFLPLVARGERAAGGRVGRVIN
ncbi:hypothetical protein PPUJ20066_44840 [Pseudomonas putida]|nr:hypothetical protein PPUJ20066_44840 [Pseudomonas putida]